MELEDVVDGEIEEIRHGAAEASGGGSRSDSDSDNGINSHLCTVPRMQ